MYKPFVTNRIIDNKYEMYKNKLLYTALKNAKPITRSNWVNNELPVINKKSILELKDRNRIKGYINIAQENLKFYHRLTKSKSLYTLKKYNHDYAQNKKYADNIRKCKKISMPKLNNNYKKLYNNSVLNYYPKENYNI